jgi:hypothetical protein
MGASKRLMRTPLMQSTLFNNPMRVFAAGAGGNTGGYKKPYNKKSGSTGGSSKSYEGGSSYSGGSGNYQGGGSYQGGSYGGAGQSTGTPLNYNGKRIYIRGYNITKDKVMFAVQPKPASFSETSNSYQVSKNGYIQIDFTPVEEGDSSTLLTNSKRTFILLMKNAGDILDLDTRMPYDSELDDEGTYMQYHNKDTEPIKVLRMNKIKDVKKTYRFTYCEVSQNETGEGTP